MKLFFKKGFIFLFPQRYKDRVFGKINNVNILELKNNRTFEPELLLLNKFIKQGDVCFDIGANSGEYTYQFEKCVGSENVFAFEPIPNLFKELKLLFRKVQLHKLAISNSNETNQFKIPKINGSAYATRGKLDIDIIEPDESDFDLIDVKCQTLDSFVEKHEVQKINFIKIDVEGHEFDVLKGGKKCIQTFKPIILVEIEQRHHQFDIEEIFSFIEDMDYKIEFYNLKNSTFQLRSNFDSAKDQNYSQIKSSNYINNFWCFPC
jgi:FkbM family methyltransferase